MHRRAVLIVALVLSASMAAGQQASAPFWQTPGQTVRDAKGNITYTEIKDPKTFTMKVLNRGQWSTYHYEPNSTKLVRIEAPDTTDDYLYEGDNWNGLTVHARGRAHTIHVTKSTIAADDMPPVTIERDARGRDVSVKRGTDVVATITYDASGQVRRLTVGAITLDLTIQSDGVREVLTANGTVLVSTVAKAVGKRQFPVSLDPVIDRLGLAHDWLNTVHVTGSATGSLFSVSDSQSRPVVEIVQLGGMGAAFDTKSAPLFYELRLNYIATPAPTGGDAFADVTTLLNGALPDSLIVPVTGDAAAYVSRPSDGAISNFWTADGSVTMPFRFVVYHEGTSAASLPVVE
jgi:hypothetical protein